MVPKKFGQAAEQNLHDSTGTLRQNHEVSSYKDIKVFHQHLLFEALNGGEPPLSARARL